MITADFNEMRIIAVDDDQHVLDLLQVILLTDASVELEVFSSPHMALKAINACMRKFDCIVLDVMMPEMDGITLCQKIRANPRYRDTPIVMLTAKSDIDCISSAFAAGATDYICKPFDIHEVQTRIRLANELCSARNEIRILRTRAGIEKRKIKAGASCSPRDELGVDEDSHSKEEPALDSVEPAAGARDCKERVTRFEVIQLFSNDFTKHENLHRTRKRKRVC